LVKTEELIFSFANNLGFDLVGFSEIEILNKEIHSLEKWLSNSFHADMTYMNHNIEKRKDIREILPEAKSVISLGVNYFVDNKYSNESDKAKISRYAWGEDYHLVLWKMMDELIIRIKNEIPEFIAKSYVDTGPVMDKVWAVKSGLGWMGKNSNIINKKNGSYFFIGNIINNLSLKNPQLVKNFCGTCNACINACPTNAIVKNFVVDANKCISYLTIENKGEISSEFKGKFNNWIFGCDICQEVCPWNIKFAVKSHHREFSEHFNRELDLNSVENMNDEEFKIKFEKSPIKRTKLSGLKRNKKFLIEEK